MATISPLEKFYFQNKKTVLEKITAKQINFSYFFFLFPQRFKAGEGTSLIEHTYNIKPYTLLREPLKKNCQIINVIHWSPQNNGKLSLFVSCTFEHLNFHHFYSREDPPNCCLSYRYFHNLSNDFPDCGQKNTAFPRDHSSYNKYVHENCIDVFCTRDIYLLII